nr:hypothetical protein [Chthoniobacterales bacterium]
LTGPAGVECRRGSGLSSNNHQVVFQFAQAATFTGATCGGVATTTSVSGNEVTVNCNGIANAQTVTASLLNVIDGTGPARTVSVPMSVLLGDTNADRSVNSADIGQTKSRSGQPVSAANFRSDVNVDGTLNSADIGLVKSKSGTALP